VYLLGGAESQNILKIAVMGMGVAGSYLMARLKDSEHEVVGYERMIEERHDSICAWGTIKSELYKFCEKTGRDFDDFMIHDGKTMKVKMGNGVKFDIGLHGLCTYNKLGLINSTERIDRGGRHVQETKNSRSVGLELCGLHVLLLRRLDGTGPEIAQEQYQKQ